MPRTPFGKTTSTEKPYAIYSGPNGFEWRVLKTYQHPENEGTHARWFVAAKSDHTGGEYEYGDTYAGEIQHHGILVSASPLWIELYGPLWGEGDPVEANF